MTTITSYHIFTHLYCLDTLIPVSEIRSEMEPQALAADQIMMAPFVKEVSRNVKLWFTECVSFRMNLSC
jgi:hypothetical protein